LSADHVGTFLVTLLVLGMMGAPALTVLTGGTVVASALTIRATVSLAALLLVTIPFSVPGSWRRMLAVALLATHHVGVGVAAGLPTSLLIELIAGTIFVGSLGCWMLPRGGFGAVLGLILALGTVGLGALSTGAPPLAVAIWAGIFLMGGGAAELSVWVSHRVHLATTPPPVPGIQPDARMLAEQVGIGVASVRDAGRVLSDASPALQEMTADWSSPTDWWTIVRERQRAPVPGSGPMVIEMFTPEMSRRRAYRMWAVANTATSRVYVQEISATVDVRREARRLSRSLEAARDEAEAARDERLAALRARSHNLRTPLSNVMASLELASLSVEDGATVSIVGEDVQSAQHSARLLLSELNHLLEDIVSESQGVTASDVIDLVGIVDEELDALQSARSIRRSYAQTILPVRGSKGELTALIQAVVRRSVVASRGTVLVHVEPLDTGELRVEFQVSDRDAELIWAAIRELTPRAASMGGRLESGGGQTPALVIPADNRDRRGVEAEVTWPGGRLTPAPPSPQLVVDDGALDLLEDDPTHIGFARQSASLRASRVDQGRGR